MPQTAEAFLEEPQQSAEDFLGESEGPNAEDFLQGGASVAQMASATRATVGVVGRAIAATDFAVAHQPEHIGEIPQPTDRWGRPVDPRGRPPEELNPAWEGTRLSSITGGEMLTRTPIPLPEIDFGILGPSQANVSTGTKIAAGAYNATKDLVDFASSPLGISTLLTGGMPALVQRLVAAGYAVDMARHTPEQVTALAEAIESGDAQAISQTATSLGITVGMTGLTARHALTSSAPGAIAARAINKAVGETKLADPNIIALTRVAPLTAEAVEKVAPIETISPKVETTTPLTTEAVTKVVEKEPVPEIPTPTPAAVAGESGTTPVTAGEPPAKFSVTPEVTLAKPEGDRTLTTEPEGRVTGIKNAQVDLERQARGQEPILRGARVGNEEVWDRTMARIEREPEWQDQLIDELKTKARTPSADEIVALDHRYVELQNEYHKATAEGDAYFKSGDAEGVAAAKAKTDFLEGRLAELEQVARNVGAEWGRSGQMRQRLMKEDFTLAAMEARERASKGFEPLTEKEHADIKKLHDELAASRAVTEKLEAEKIERDATIASQQALLEAQASATPSYEPRVLQAAEKFAAFMDKKGEDALARIKTRLGRTSAGIDPTILSDVGILGAAKITRGAVDFAKWTEAMVRDLGEWFREHAQEGWEAAQKAFGRDSDSFHKGVDKTTKEKIKKASQTPTPAADRASIVEGLKESVAEGAEGAEIGRYARAIAEGFIKEGVRELEPLTDAVHGVLKEVLPDITRTQSRDAWTQYGKYKQLNTDPTKVRLRELSTEGQKVSTIERLERGLAGLKTGSERQAPTDKALRLQKRINELKKELGIVTTDPATQLRSALDAIKTRNANRIKDLRYENSTRTRIVRNKRVSPTDEEVVAQRAEIEALKKENEEIFGGKELTDEQRLARAIAAAERAETAANERLTRAEKGDFAKPAGRPIPESEALNEIRARTAALRQERELLQDLATPKKTPDQIALQALKTRLALEKADLTRRLAEGDFSPRKKPPRELELDPETAAARAQVDKLKSEFAQRLERHKYEQKTRLEKIWHGIKAARGAVLNIASSYDFSASRQALGALLSGVNRIMVPIEIARDASGATRLSYINQLESARMLGRSFKRMFQAWSSEVRAGAIEQKRLARANSVSGADKAMGIHYSELNSNKFTRYEENAHSILDEWAKLPLADKDYAKATITAPFKLGARGVRASNRAFITFLNSTRAELADHLLEINFKDRAPTKLELEIIGNGVNIATGRGKLGPRTSTVASTVLWAPQLLASRVQALTGQPLWTGHWAGSARARTIVAKEYARAIASGYLLWQVSRLFDEKDETNPTSSDFGKIVRGETRIDVWGGLQQVTTLGARTVSATTKSLKGKESDIGAAKKYGQRGIWYVWSDFVRSKLRPDVGTAVDIITRTQGPTDKKTTIGHVAESLLVPLPMRDITDILRERGFTEGMIIEALGQFGAGVSNYEDREGQK